MKFTLRTGVNQYTIQQSFFFKYIASYANQRPILISHFKNMSIVIVQRLHLIVGEWQWYNVIFSVLFTCNLIRGHAAVACTPLLVSGIFGGWWSDVIYTAYNHTSYVYCICVLRLTVAYSFADSLLSDPPIFFQGLFNFMFYSSLFRHFLFFLKSGCIQ